MTRIIEITRRSGGAASAAASADRAETAANAAEDALALIQAIQKLETWQGQWLTATAYEIGDLVYQSGSTYICLVAHTSGTFNTDLSAVRWQLFASQGAAGGGTGDMLKSENLSGLSNTTTAIGNLGLTDRIHKAGDVIITMGSQARDGALKMNGATVSRSSYAALWAYAQASGRLAASEGAKGPGEFGPGNGSTTFSLPDVRGYFPRMWDDGRGIDSGRTLGSYQDDAIVNHTHSGTTGTTGNHVHSASQDAHSHTVQTKSNSTSFGDVSRVTEANNANGSSRDRAITSTVQPNVYVGAAGDHAHPFTTGNPNSGGAAETRVKNLNFCFWVAY